MKDSKREDWHKVRGKCVPFEYNIEGLGEWVETGKQKSMEFF